MSFFALRSLKTNYILMNGIWLIKIFHYSAKYYHLWSNCPGTILQSQNTIGAFLFSIIHLKILCFHFVSKLQFYKDHQCHKYLTKQQSFNRTTLLDNNVFHKFT